MKKTAIYFLVFIALNLVGCTTHITHINQVKDKWGTPAKIEYQDDTVINYWYFYKGKGRYIITGKPLTALVMDSLAKTGWYIVEITTDMKGKILNKRKYWKQPEIQ